MENTKQLIIFLAKQVQAELLKLDDYMIIEDINWADIDRMNEFLIGTKEYKTHDDITFNWNANTVVEFDTGKAKIHINVEVCDANETQADMHGTYDIATDELDFWVDGDKQLAKQFEDEGTLEIITKMGLIA